jgi:ABC-type branched-subunit amino acid transport system permease subunit
MTARSFWGLLIGSAIVLMLQDYISSETQNWISFIGLFCVLAVLISRVASSASSGERRQRDTVAG